MENQSAAETAEISRRVAEKKSLEHGPSQAHVMLGSVGMARFWGEYKVLREVCLDIEWEGLLVERAYRMDLVADDRVLEAIPFV